MTDEITTAEDVVAAYEIPVRLEVGEDVANFDDLNRKARRSLQGQVKKFRTQFAAYKDLRDSEGRGVTIVIKSPKKLSLQATVSLEIPEELKASIAGNEKAERVA